MQRNLVRSADTNSQTLVGSFAQSPARPNLSPAELQPLDYGQLFESSRGGDSSRSQPLKQSQRQPHRPQQPQHQHRSLAYETVPLSMLTQQRRNEARYHVFRRFPIKPIIPGTMASFTSRHPVKTRPKPRSKDFGSSPNRNLTRVGRIYESQSIWRNLKQRS